MRGETAEPSILEPRLGPRHQPIGEFRAPCARCDEILTLDDDAVVELIPELHVDYDEANS